MWCPASSCPLMSAMHLSKVLHRCTVYPIRSVIINIVYNTISRTGEPECHILPIRDYPNLNGSGGGESVCASVRRHSRDSPRSDADAVLVATGVRSSTAHPDAVRSGCCVDRRRAREQACAVEGQVVGAVQHPSLEVRVLAAGGTTGRRGVLQHSLTHAGAVGVELLRDVGGSVEEQRAVVQVEGGALARVRGVAGCVLGGGANGDTALRGLEGGILEVTAGADGDQAERCVVRNRAVALAGKDSRCGGRGGEQRGESKELHDVG